MYFSQPYSDAHLQKLLHCIMYLVSTERYILFLCVFAGTATTWPRETRAAVEVAARMILLKKPGMFHYKGEGKEKRHAPLVVVKWRIALQKMETV